MNRNQTLMFPAKEALTLEQLCDGKVLSEINESLGKLQMDISDRSKVAQTTREITIKIKIKTDDRRNVESIQPQVTVKLAPFEVEGGQRWFDYETMGDNPR